MVSFLYVTYSVSVQSNQLVIYQYTRDVMSIFKGTYSISILGNLQFQVQFGINLHKWVFQKAEIARATLVSAVLAFLKNSQVQISFKLITFFY